MLAVKTFNYNGQNISQRGDGFINLTQMCKATDVILGKWIQLKDTRQYIDELQSQYPEARVVQTRQGAQDGTWGHPNVARKLAAWISPDFSIWCDIHMFNLMSPVNTNSSSPFDGIRHVDDAGNEWWSARELMPLLGYTKWQRFVDAIDKTKVSIAITGQTVENHITGAGNVVKRPQGGGSDPLDYKLSRRACYLVAMNGDHRKPEIAAAQAYFVVKTREAEVVIHQQSDELERLKLINENLKLQIRRDELESSMLTIHGPSVLLTLRGCSDQIVREEVLVTEVVNEATKHSQRILTAKQLEKEVMRRTGQKLKSLKDFIEVLRAKGRDDLFVAITRSYTNEYPTPETLDEAISVYCGDNRQKLLGE